MAVLIWGFAALFAVSMPTNAAFFTSNSTVFSTDLPAAAHGLILPGLLTTFMAMAGGFGVSLYEHVALLTFLVFLFLVIIVMFNVLIAIVAEIYVDLMATAEVGVRGREAQVIIDEGVCRRLPPGPAAARRAPRCAVPARWR